MLLISDSQIATGFYPFEIGSKEPFDEIMEQFSDEELRALLNLIMGYEDVDFRDTAGRKYCHGSTKHVRTGCCSRI